MDKVKKVILSTLVTSLMVHLCAEEKSEVDKEKSSKFKVMHEAKMPEGFPAPGQLGEIVVKEYPAYRAAKVVDGQQNVAFMKLFYHIKQNNIAMTSPVEMSLKENGARGDMAFLYGSMAMGDLGHKENGVEVVDVPARRVVSIGFNGYESEKAINEAKVKLEKWLSEQKEYVADGSYRLLGYNSPMVPAAKRFWEVQIPLKSAKNIEEKP